MRFLWSVATIRTKTLRGVFSLSEKVASKSNEPNWYTSSRTFSDVKVIPYVFSNNCVSGNSWFIYSNQLVEYDLDNFLVGTTKMHSASCTLKSRSLRTMKAAISSFFSAAQQPGELCVVVFISSVLIRHLAFIRKFVGLL